jgi:hypothetical protein
VIPFSRGGAANPDNLRLVHGDCNRHKSNSLDEILASNPVLNLLQVKR